MADAPQQVTIVDTGPPAPPPKPTTTINVGAVPPTAATLSDQPKPGSARERMFKDLAKKAKPATGQPSEPTPEPPKPAEKPIRPGAPDPTLEDDDEQTPTQVDDPASKPAPDPKPAPGPDPDKKKSPWKVVDEYKARLTKAETELAEVRKSAVPKEQREREQKEVDTIRKRNEELENEIRFVNYSKSQHYQDTYEKPYDEAWNKAMNELQEIEVEDPASGERRAVTPKDLLQLVNMPMGKAREVADKVFGPFANDVMAYRKEIRNLFEAKSKALEDARTAGVEREKQQTEKIVNFRKGIQDSVAERWGKANEKIISHERYGKFFKPIEGDENINQRLAKGYQMVDRALDENPHDPRLSAEQRASIVDRHAAVRHRAAAFGRVVYELDAALGKIEALEKQLASYESSEPTTESGGASPTSGTTGTSSPWNNLRSSLHKIAK